MVAELTTDSLSPNIMEVFSKRTPMRTAQSVAEIDDLFCACSRSNKFGAVRSCLDGSLQLRMPVDRCLVEKVQDTCDRSSTNHVMIQVCIDMVRRDDRVAQGWRSVVW